MAEALARARDLRGVPEQELRERVTALRLEMWQHRLKARANALQQTHLLRTLRRQAARIHTVLNERKTNAKRA